MEPMPPESERANPVGIVVFCMVLCFPYLYAAMRLIGGYSMGESLIFASAIAFIAGSFIVPAFFVVAAGTLVVVIEATFRFYEIVTTTF